MFGPHRPWRLIVAALLGALVTLTTAVPAYAAEDAKLVLVLDSSGSMAERVGGDTKISIAKSALRTVISRLPAEARVGLRVYGATVENRGDKGACTDSQLVVPIGTGNRQALREEIKKYRPYGETPISYSLGKAADDLGSDGRRTIVLVSDGEETCDADPCDTAAAIAKRGINLKIDVIGLRVRGKARSQLRCIADKGNGTYFDADSKVEIEESLDKLATRAFRPFTLNGTPVEGTLGKSDAPRVTPGQYLDRMPGGDDPLYYRIPRTMPGSTLHVGVTTLASRGDILGLSPVITAADGTRCGQGFDTGVAYVGSRPVVSAEASSWVRDEGSPCFTDDELLLEMPSNNDLQGKRFELVVSEEPPVTDMRRLPEAVGDFDWASMKRAGSTTTKAPVAGSSISDAPVLTAGVYTARILTGENQVYAVNAGWGQRVQVQLTVAPRRGALARAVDVSSSLDLRLIGAGRGTYSNLQPQGMPRSDVSMIRDDTTYRVYGGTPEVRYLNRAEYAVRPAARPGPQYLVVNFSNDTERYLLPYTLTVKVIGEAGKGAPAYAGETSATPTPTLSSDPPTPSPSAAPDPPESGGAGVPLGVAVGIGVGALALGAAGAAAALAIRRRGRSET